MHRVPPASAKFLYYIDQFAKLYDQRVAMDYEIRRSNIDDFKDTSAYSHSSLSKHSIKPVTESYQSAPLSFANHYQQNPSSRSQADLLAPPC